MQSSSKVFKLMGIIIGSENLINSSRFWIVLSMRMNSFLVTSAREIRKSLSSIFSGINSIEPPIIVNGFLISWAKATASSPIKDSFSERVKRSFSFFSLRDLEQVLNHRGLFRI